MTQQFLWTIIGWGVFCIIGMLAMIMRGYYAAKKEERDRLSRERLEETEKLQGEAHRV